MSLCKCAESPEHSQVQSIGVYEELDTLDLSSNEGSGEPVQMRRVTRAFTGSKYWCL